MDSVNVPLASFRPRTGTMEAWNAAYVRVEDYLRAHRIHNRLHQSRLIQAVLERAAELHAADPSQDPTTLAATEIERRMEAWFQRVLGAPDIPIDRVSATGRVALLLSDGAQRWPYAFLDLETIPADFGEAMHSSSMKAGPDLAVSNMVPREIDLGPLTEAAGETLEVIEKWPLLRMFILWGVFIAALGAIFYLTR